MNVIKYIIVWCIFFFVFYVLAYLIIEHCGLFFVNIFVNFISLDFSIKKFKKKEFT